MIDRGEDQRGAAEASVAAAGIGPGDLAALNHSQFMRRAEAAYMAAVLEAADCNKRRAAEIAGMTYDTFCRRVAALDLRFRVVIGA